MSNTLFKKVIATVAALSIVLSIVTPITGVKAADNSVEAANRLAALGVIVDNSSNPSAYNLGSNITRREMLKIMMNLSSVEVSETCEGKFADLKPNDWGCKYAETALKAGFIAANPNFRPNDLVTEAEALKMIMQARGVAKKVGVEPWSEAYRQAAVEAGILSADAKVSATGAAKRSMVIVSADSAVTNTTKASDDSEDVNLDDLFGDLFADDSEDITEEQTSDKDNSDKDTSDESSSKDSKTVVTGNNLEVSLNPTSPVAQSLPQGSTAVKVMSFDLTAGTSDISVNEITLTRGGLGAPTDYSNVSLWSNGVRLTSGRSISSSTNKVSFVNVGLVVKAGKTTTLDVLVDVDGTTSGNQNVLSIVSKDDIKLSTGEVKGIFPITGNSMTIGWVTVGKVDVESNSSAYTRKVGETNVEVANFSVHVNSTEDAQFEGITLYNSSRDVLDNLKLYRGNDVVATAVKNGFYYSFILTTPFQILKGDSASFTVKWDVVNARNSDTSRLYVRYKSDVRVKGKTYGYNLKVDNTVGADIVNSYVDEVDATPQSNTTTIEAGWLTVSKVGPAATDIAKNTNGIKLLDFNITPAADTDVEKLVINLAGNGNLIAGDVQNLKIVCGWVVVDEKALPIIWNNSFTQKWSLSGGKTTSCSILIDITNQAAWNETITATLKDLKQSANAVFKAVSTQDTITDIVPSWDIAGNVMSVKAASLTLDVLSTPSSKTYVKGQSLADVVWFNLKAGDASDVKVTSVKLTAYLDDNVNNFVDPWDKNQNSNANSVMSAVYLYDDAGNKVAGPKSLTVGTTDITVTFDSLNLAIAKWANLRLVAKADISSTAPISANDDRIALTIANAWDVKAEYGNGVNLTPILSTNNNAPTVSQTITTNWVLSVSNDSSSPTTKLIVAGSNNNEVFKFRFSATKENILVNKLRIVGTNTANVNSITISYPTKSGSTTKTTTFVWNNADFTWLGLFVEKDKNATVTVSVNTNSITAGATSNASLAFTFDYDDAFEAITEWSNEKTTSVGLADVTWANMVIRKSQPIIATQTIGTTKLSNGLNKPIYKMTVVADKDDVILAAINFNVVTGWGTAVSNYKLYVNNVDKTADWGFVGSKFTYNAGQDLVISAGQTATIELRADIAWADAASDYLSVNLVEDTGNTAGNFAAVNGTNPNLVWSDNSASNHSRVTTDWYVWYKVNGLTTTSIDLTY